MKYLFVCILLGALTLGCSDAVLTQAADEGPDVAMKAPLYGTMDLEYNLAWPGPNVGIPDWAGTITIDGDVHGMVFYNIGTGKPFDEAFIGHVVKFGEIWVIFEGPVVYDAGGTVINEDVLIQGTDAGVTVIPNSTYRMTGVVTEAHGDYADWDGRHVSMIGDIIWYEFGAPHFAPGILRLN